MTTLTALVTGASRGIGAAIAQHLNSDGWHVLAPSRSELDLAKPESIEAYLAGIQEVYGLVLNAGINEPAPLADINDEDWQRIHDTNVTSAFRLLRALAPRMADQSGGRIVAISSAYSTRARRDGLLTVRRRRLWKGWCDRRPSSSQRTTYWSMRSRRASWTPS